MKNPEDFSEITRDLSPEEAEEFEKNKKITLQITAVPAGYFATGNLVALYDRQSGSRLSGKVISCKPHPDLGQLVELEWMGD